MESRHPAHTPRNTPASTGWCLSHCPTLSSCPQALLGSRSGWNVQQRPPGCLSQEERGLQVRWCPASALTLDLRDDRRRQSDVGVGASLSCHSARAQRGLLPLLPGRQDASRVQQVLNEKVTLFCLDEMEVNNTLCSCDFQTRRLDSALGERKGDRIFPSDPRTSWLPPLHPGLLSGPARGTSVSLLGSAGDPGGPFPTRGDALLTERWGGGDAGLRLRLTHKWVVWLDFAFCFPGWMMLHSILLF